MTTKPRLAEPLDIGHRQLAHRGQRIRETGATPEDLAGLAGYLQALAEHGSEVVHMAVTVFEQAPCAVLELSTAEAADVEVYLDHIDHLFQTVQTLAGEVYGRLHRSE